MTAAQRVEAFLRDATVAAEMAERNAQALEQWRLRQAHGGPSIDPAPPVWRHRLDLWFAERRDLARRWMFIQRCRHKSTQRLRQLLPPAPRSLQR